MSIYTAQKCGAKKLSRIKDGAKCAVGVNITICVFTIIMLTLFANSIISIFMTEVDTEVLSLAKEYLHIIMVFLMFLGFLMIFRNILQGMGSVIAPLASGIAELILRTIFAFIFGYYFGFTGICTATPAAWIGATIVLYIGFRISLKSNAKKIRIKNQT